MSTRKKKEPAAKKHKNFKPKEVKEAENTEETASEEISADSFFFLVLMVI